MFSGKVDSDAVSSKPCVLIVDDKPEENHLLVRMLKSEEFHLKIAFDGLQGYQRALSLLPDLILMDIHMPKMDGYAACRMLKANPVTQNIPVIFLTVADSPEERVKGLVTGGVDYISKPFTPSEVLARIRIHLELAKRPCAPAPPAPIVRAILPDDVILAAATRVISERLGEPLTLSDIARAIGTHEKKLSQIVNRKTGLTAYSYVREIRIRRARKLLEETSISIQDIADEIGFQNAGNFSTAFRERTGITPRSYRLAMQSRLGPTPSDAGKSEIS